MKGKNIFENVPDQCGGEIFETLLEHCNVTVERIVSRGQASPEGYWYDQDWDEWVVLLQGSTAVLFEGEETFSVLKPGDYLWIPAHKKHRVEWTDSHDKTIWLTIHIRPEKG